MNHTGESPRPGAERSRVALCRRRASIARLCSLSSVLGTSRGRATLRSVYLLAFCSKRLLARRGRQAATLQPGGSALCCRISRLLERDVGRLRDKLRFFEQLKAIMNERARILLVEPRLFHVSRKEFEATTSLAEDAGFVVSRGPRLLLSWSAVLGNA